MAIFAFALLTQKRTYLLIERVMCVVAAATVRIARGMLQSRAPQLLACLPEGNGQSTPLPRAWDPPTPDRLLTAITFAGLGGFWTLFYSYWILGKGVGVQRTPSGNGQVPMTAAGDLVTQGKRWRRFLLADTGIGVFGNLATTLMTCFLAYAVLFPKGIVPDEWRLAAEQARFFEVSWGTAGRALFLAISAAFLCDTWLSTADAVARVHVEMIRFYFFRETPVDERKWYRWMIVVLTLITGATMFANQPGPLIVISALIGFVGTVSFTIALIVLIHGPLKRALPQPLKPGRVSLIALSIRLLLTPPSRGLPQDEIFLVTIRRGRRRRGVPTIWPNFARAPAQGALRADRFLHRPIRFSEQGDRMHDAHRQLPVAEAIHDLEEAAGIAGRDHVSTRGLDMLNLAFEKVARHFGLDQVIDARAAAAPRTLRKFNAA
jgi:hypothetical protein